MTYYPMKVDAQSARRGVRLRLLGALVAVSVTLVCFVYAALSAMSTFGATFALAVGLCSFGAAVALLLSARQEEEVHALAARLDAESSGHPMRSAERLVHSCHLALPEADYIASHAQFCSRTRFERDAHLRVYHTHERYPDRAGRVAPQRTDTTPAYQADNTDGAI